MRVLRLVGGFDRKLGGPSVASYTSMLAAARAGIVTDLAFSDLDAPGTLQGQRCSTLRDAGVTIWGFPLLARSSASSRKFALSPAMARFLVGSIHRYELVHAHGAWVLPTALATVLGRDTRVVLTPHESLSRFDLDSSTHFGAAAGKRLVAAMYRRRLAAIVYSSDIERRDSIVRGRPYAAVIPHALPAVSRCRPRVEDGRLRVGLLGRLHQKKRIDLLIRALALAPASVVLVVAGEGEEHGRLTALANDLGVADRIEWLGFVDETGKEAFFGDIDVLAMPSDYECFGMAAAEAMAAGRPVIVSREVGVESTVEQYRGGWTCRRDPHEIADLLGRLLQTPSLVRERGNLAHHAAISKFSLDAHGTALADLYAVATER